jgi:hypothetical protein
MDLKSFDKIRGLFRRPFGIGAEGWRVGGSPFLDWRRNAMLELPKREPYWGFLMIHRGTRGLAEQRDGDEWRRKGAADSVREREISLASYQVSIEILSGF